MLERVKGIEPSSSAWKAVALPLSYTRMRAVRRRSSQKSELPRLAKPKQLPAGAKASADKLRNSRLAGWLAEP
jgi:hypothetical protein